MDYTFRIALIISSLSLVLSCDNKPPPRQAGAVAVTPSPTAEAPAALVAPPQVPADAAEIPREVFTSIARTVEQAERALESKARWGPWPEDAAALRELGDIRGTFDRRGDRLRLRLAVEGEALDLLEVDAVEDCGMPPFHPDWHVSKPDHITGVVSPAWLVFEGASPTDIVALRLDIFEASLWYSTPTGCVGAVDATGLLQETRKAQGLPAWQRLGMLDVLRGPALEESRMLAADEEPEDVDVDLAVVGLEGRLILSATRWAFVGAGDVTLLELEPGMDLKDAECGRVTATAARRGKEVWLGLEASVGGCEPMDVGYELVRIARMTGTSAQVVLDRKIESSRDKSYSDESEESNATLFGGLTPIRFRVECTGGSKSGVGRCETPTDPEFGKQSEYCLDVAEKSCRSDWTVGSDTRSVPLGVAKVRERSEICGECGI